MFWNELAINLKRPLKRVYGQKMSPQFGRFEEPFKGRVGKYYKAETWHPGRILPKKIKC